MGHSEKRYANGERRGSRLNPVLGVLSKTERCTGMAVNGQHPSVSPGNCHQAAFIPKLHNLLTVTRLGYKGCIHKHQSWPKSLYIYHFKKTERVTKVLILHFIIINDFIFIIMYSTTHVFRIKWDKNIHQAPYVESIRSYPLADPVSLIKFSSNLIKAGPAVDVLNNIYI